MKRYCSLNTSILNCAEESLSVWRNNELVEKCLSLIFSRVHGSTYLNTSDQITFYSWYKQNFIFLPSRHGVLYILGSVWLKETTIEDFIFTKKENNYLLEMIVRHSYLILCYKLWRSVSFKIRSLNTDKAVKLSWEKKFLWLVYTYRKKRYLYKYIFFYLKWKDIETIGK